MQRTSCQACGLYSWSGNKWKKICVLSNEEQKEKRRELKIPEEKQVLLSVGELIPRKNHESAIRAIAKLQDPSIVYVICGHGQLDEKLRTLVKTLGVEKQVLFAGYRSDIFEIYQIADLYVFPSYQEGLPTGTFGGDEFWASSGLLCYTGHRDLMEVRTEAEEQLEERKKNEKMPWYRCSGGTLVRHADDVDAYAEAIQDALNHPEWLAKLQGME